MRRVSFDARSMRGIVFTEVFTPATDDYFVAQGGFHVDATATCRRSGPYCERVESRHG
jgi:hypothetical protein